jgi:hypothetical protein
VPRSVGCISHVGAGRIGRCAFAFPASRTSLDREGRAADRRLVHESSSDG